MHYCYICYAFIEFLIIKVFAEEPKVIISTILKNQNEYFISLAIGKPPQKVQMRIDQSLPYTLTTQSWFSKEDSLTFKTLCKLTLDLDSSSSTLAEEITDQLLFLSNGNIINNYSFYLVDYDNRNNPPRIGFAFGYKYIKETFSLVHLLKQQGNIDHISYGFHLSNKKGNGRIFFGGIPQNETKEKQMAKCKVNPHQDHWGCELLAVFINNISDISYKNIAEVKFQIGEDRIIAPEDFMLFLSNTLFRDYIDKHHCTFHNSTSHKYIDCNNGFIGAFPKFYFRFSDFAIGVDLNNFWWRDEFYCEFLIQSNTKLGNAWTFGSLFMMNKFLLFDYEQRGITIYSDNDIISYHSFDEEYFLNRKRKGMIVLYGLCFVFALLGSAVGIVIKVKERSKGIA